MLLPARLIRALGINWLRLIMKEYATLIVAGVAAAASILTLFLNIKAQRAAEDRKMYRQNLDPFLADLAEHIYQIVAATNVLLKVRTPEKFKLWSNRAAETNKKLSQLRPKLRYPLWGIDEGIRTLIRFPTWVQHARKNPKRTEALLRCGNRLRSALDFSIRRSYMKGRPPTFYERAWIWFIAKRCRELFENKEAYREYDAKVQDELIEDKLEIGT